jgi:hypothetical protein
MLWRSRRKEQPRTISFVSVTPAEEKAEGLTNVQSRFTRQLIEGECDSFGKLFAYFFAATE